MTITNSRYDCARCSAGQVCSAGRAAAQGATSQVSGCAAGSVAGEGTVPEATPTEDRVRAPAPPTTAREEPLAHEPQDAQQRYPAGKGHEATASCHLAPTGTDTLKNQNTVLVGSGHWDLTP